MRYVLSGLLFSLLLHANSVYEACGATKQEAKAQLANQIVSTVDSSFTLDENVTQDTVTKKAARKISTTSRLTLSNVHYTPHDDGVCASISKEELIAITQGKLKAIQNFSLNNLPNDTIAKVNYLEERLDELRQAKAIMTLISDVFTAQDFELVEKMLEQFTNERSNHYAQSVSFNIVPLDSYSVIINGTEYNRTHNIYLPKGTHSYTIKRADMADYSGAFELKKLQKHTIALDLAGNMHALITVALTKDAQVVVDGKPFEANTPTYVAPGQHTYRITHPSFCPVEGTFEAKLGSKKSINVALENYVFPQITVVSNQKDALLKIGGDEAALGQKKMFSSCRDTTISYSVHFDGQTKTGVVELKPGVERTVHVNFLTLKDIDALKAVAKNYETNKRWIARAGYDFGGLASYQIDTLGHSKWLRYGMGVEYATGGNNNYFGAHYIVAMQFTRFGKHNIPLNIDGIALIPYVGAKIGAGLMLNQAFHTQLGSVIGVDGIINEHFSVELYYHQNYIDRGNGMLGVAFSMVSPFN